MLQNHKELADKISEKFKSIDFWPELTFNDSDILNIQQIDDVAYVNKHSIQLNIDGNNHSIIPSQYILYAICVKELALNTKEFMDAFELVRQGKSSNELGEQITNKTLDYSTLDLDDYSKSIASQIFFNEDFNLGAKSIVNGTSGKYKIRGVSDFFGSIILKPINIPNASSTILGRFIFNLTENKPVYDYLERRFINITPYIIKNNITKVFAKQVFSFLYQYDNLEAIEFIIEENEQDNLISIKDDGISLTSIFKISDHLLGVSDLSFSDGRLRYFTEPLFINDEKFYYFSTEWTNGTNSRLDLKTLKKIIEKFYPEFELTNKDSFHILLNSEEKLITSKNIIFYGAPGTGKSHKIENILKDIPDNRKERITFHPEYDYSCFVGGYRPSSELNEETKKQEITYKFIPQVFTNIYVNAWKNPSKDYFLAIEEINRGNCAEIFGDLFQLLDRKSDYSISPSKELKEHLQPLLAGTKGLEGGKMKLPSNLNILASMNTSDQSLFPMDSAFKRRWDWEYMPINEKKFNDDGTETHEPTKNDSYEYIVKIDNNLSFRWIDFIINVNEKIKLNRNLGSDKYIGNYFIKPNDKEISLNEFINKVIFYLWIDVFKDEDESIFSLIKTNTSYENFFPINSHGKDNIIKLVSEILKIKITDNRKKTEATEEQQE